MKIELRQYHYTCGEPCCCDEYGTNIYIDGDFIGEGHDEVSILQEVLNSLGHEPEIIETYEDDEEAKK